jgi:hypothetical protein
VRLCGAVFVALLFGASVAYATPVLTATAQFNPIEGFAHTGDILGAGARIESKFTIAGSEYGGYPAPLTAIGLYLPRGTVLRRAGFSTCSVARLEEDHEPTTCPRGSKAGPVGAATEMVSYGSEIRDAEAMTVEPFFTPEGLAFDIAGQSPFLIETFATGAWATPVLGNGFGPELTSTMPPIETVLHDGLGSTTELTLNVAGAYQRVSETGARQTSYYLRVPRRCPKGGLRWKAELSFSAVAGQGASTVVTESRIPCPRREAASTPAVEAPAAPEPTRVPGTDGVVTAPPAEACVSGGEFEIHIQRSKGIRYRRANVFVNGHQVAVVERARLGATVDLRGLLKGRSVVKIVVLTMTGRRLTGVRVYHGCAAKAAQGATAPLDPSRRSLEPGRLDLDAGGRLWHGRHQEGEQSG